MPMFRVDGSYSYEAWPETANAARYIRKIARVEPVGNYHLLTAAIVMTAVSVEGFCQALGPNVYGEAWSAGKRPAEKYSVKVKLKCIAEHYGVLVNFGMKPWNWVAELLSIRDSLVHPKPEVRLGSITLDAADSGQALDKYKEEILRKFSPMHDIGRLEEVAKAMEQKMCQIWAASGKNTDPLMTGGVTNWSVTRADLE